MTEWEKAQAGYLYDANYDEEIVKARIKCADLCYEFNNLRPSDSIRQKELLHKILGEIRGDLVVTAPFYCDYGSHIEAGKNLFINYNCTIIDVAKVIIGDNCQIAPNVAIYTAGHPVHPDTRNSLYEYGIGITIGDNVWIGGNTVILPGVHIGSNTVIGAGSVVTKDVPDWVIAAGNPCKVIRKITEEDRPFYYKDRKFDPEAWAEVEAYVREQARL